MSARRKKRAGMVVGVRLDGTAKNPLHVNGLVDLALDVPDHVLVALLATYLCGNGHNVESAVVDARELVRLSRPAVSP